MSITTPTNNTPSHMGSFPLPGSSSQNGESPNTEAPRLTHGTPTYVRGGSMIFQRAAETFQPQYHRNPYPGRYSGSAEAQKAPFMPTEGEPGVHFIRAPFSEFPNSLLHPNGLTYDLLEQNPEWFLHTEDFIKEDGSNPTAMSYPVFLEPPSIYKASNKSEGRRLRCTFCRRTYDLTNGRSVWRRHVYENHKIAMGNRREGFHGRGSRRTKDEVPKGVRRTDSVYETSQTPTPTNPRARSKTLPGSAKAANKSSKAEKTHSRPSAIARSSSQPESRLQVDYSTQHQSPVSHARSAEPEVTSTPSRHQSSMTRYRIVTPPWLNNRKPAQLSVSPESEERNMGDSDEEEDDEPHSSIPIHIPSYRPTASPWRINSPYGPPTVHPRAIPIGSLLNDRLASSEERSTVSSSRSRRAARGTASPSKQMMTWRHHQAAESDESGEDDADDVNVEWQEIYNDRGGAKMDISHDYEEPVDQEVVEHGRETEGDRMEIDGESTRRRSARLKRRTSRSSSATVRPGGASPSPSVVEEGVVVFSRSTAGLMDRYIDSIKNRR